MSTPAPSWQDLYNAGKAEALIRRPAARIEVGTRYDAILGAVAAVGDVVIGYAADRFKASYLDGAKGTDLTVLADDHFGVERRAAVPAIGLVTFTRVTPGPTAITIPTGTRLATNRDATGTEIQFVTVGPATFHSTNGGAAASISVANIPVAAVKAGAVGGVDPGTVTRILDALPESFTVTNPDFLAGGQEDETDEELRARCKASVISRRGGTFQALEFAAASVPGIARAHAVEDETGAATIYIADPKGRANGDRLQVFGRGGSSDGTLTRAVAIAVADWRAVGSAVFVQAARPLPIDVRVELVLRPGSNAQALQTSIETAVSALFPGRPGETVYRTAIATAIRNVDAQNIIEATVTMRVGTDPYLDWDIVPNQPDLCPTFGTVSIG